MTLPNLTHPHQETAVCYPISAPPSTDCAPPSGAQHPLRPSCPTTSARSSTPTPHCPLGSRATPSSRSIAPCSATSLGPPSPSAPPHAPGPVLTPTHAPPSSPPT